METTTQAAVIGTTASPAAAPPIVIKIGMPKDVEKQKIDKSKDGDAKKPTKSRFCQLLPVLLFLFTFATVLSLLIIYHDPSSEYKFHIFRVNYGGSLNGPRRPSSALRFVDEIN